MGYASSASVQSEFKNIDFSKANASITTSEVNAIIKQEEAYIDMCLSKMYIVPITDDTDKLIIRSISIQFVKSRIQTILEVKSPSPDTNQEPAWKTMKRVADRRLRALCSGEQRLPNSDLVKGSSGNFQSYQTGSNDTCLPVFERCKDQW